MHIVIAVLSGLAAVIWALVRLQNSGVDINAFNPFFWVRRRAWEKKLGTRPIHALTNPMEAAALLVVGVAEQGGSATRESKAEVIGAFASEFRIDERAATELYTAMSYLLRDVVELAPEVGNVLEPTRESFTPERVTSLLALLDGAANVEGGASDGQQAIVDAVRAVFAGDSKPESGW